MSIGIILFVYVFSYLFRSFVRPLVCSFVW